MCQTKTFLSHTLKLQMAKGQLQTLKTKQKPAENFWEFCFPDIDNNLILSFFTYTCVESRCNGWTSWGHVVQTTEGQGNCRSQY